MPCQHTTSGCNYPEGDCNGDCLIANVERLIRAKINKEHEMTDHKQPEPQAQAGEPLVFESAAEAKADREHADKYYRQAELLLTANERTLHEAIAKKDTALKACEKVLEELAAEAEKNGNSVLAARIRGRK